MTASPRSLEFLLLFTAIPTENRLASRDSRPTTKPSTRKSREQGYPGGVYGDRASLPEIHREGAPYVSS